MSETKRDFCLFLEDIFMACEKIEKYTERLDDKSFAKDEKTIDAVIRNFEVIGEAARHVPEKVKEKYPRVEWKEAVGFRNIVIHNYFGIDLESVWQTIKQNIPVLKAHIKEVLKKEKNK